MARPPRRGLFWQVYPTLLISLLIVAVCGAVVLHLLGVTPAGSVMRAHAAAHMRRPGHNLGVLLIVAALVGLAAYPVIGRITRRLEGLRLTVEAWGAGDLARRAAVDGSDEIGALAASFNAAADRTDALLGAHKALLAHASHELRSPLTRLALAVEMAVAGADAGLAAQVRREIAELDTLVEEILVASRLDHAPDIGPRELVDVLALTAEEAARAGLTVAEVAQGAGPFETLGSPRLLRRMIRNLIDNALRHGAPPVEITLARGGPPGAPTILVRVRDHGQGVAEALREQVFEPFFRPQGRTEEAGGWGLGLALARQIAERHGGAARCEAAVGGGSVFEAELPASPASG